MSTERETSFINQLMKFYGVDTLEKIIRAQDTHIENLQRELRRWKPEPEMNPGYSPREG